MNGSSKLEVEKHAKLETNRLSQQPYGVCNLRSSERCIKNELVRIGIGLKVDTSSSIDEHPNITDV